VIQPSNYGCSHVSLSLSLSLLPCYSDANPGGPTHCMLFTCCFRFSWYFCTAPCCYFAAELSLSLSLSLLPPWFVISSRKVTPNNDLTRMEFDVIRKRQDCVALWD
jgi:hypothetical protein